MIKFLQRIFFCEEYYRVESQLEELRKIEEALNKRLSESNELYTTIRSFKGMDPEFYGFVCDLLKRDEYRYMMFDLRENIFREMSSETDKEKLLRHLGRIDALTIIDNYLKRYKAEYENSIRRNQENTKG